MTPVVERVFVCSERNGRGSRLTMENNSATFSSRRWNAPSGSSDIPSASTNARIFTAGKDPPSVLMTLTPTDKSTSAQNSSSCSARRKASASLANSACAFNSAATFFTIPTKLAISISVAGPLRSASCSAALNSLKFCSGPAISTQSLAPRPRPNQRTGLPW